MFHPRFLIITFCLLGALALGARTSLAETVAEDFDYPAGPLGDAEVTGTGQVGYWQETPDRPTSSTLQIGEVEWSPAAGAPSPKAAKGVGGKTGITGAFELETPIDFDADGEVWIRFIHRRPAEATGSVGNLSLSSDQGELVRVWQTVGGGGVSAGMGQNLQASGDVFPGLDTDLFVVGRIETSADEPDVLELQITPGNQPFPETFTPQLRVSEEIFGEANRVHFWNFEAPAAKGAFFGGFRLGDSLDAVLAP